MAIKAVDKSSINLTATMQRKMNFYKAAATKSFDVALSPKAQTASLGYIRKRALGKIKGVSIGVRENIRQALLVAQSTNQSLLAATSTILGATDLEKGVFHSSRKRAAVIAREELRAARQEGLINEAEGAGAVMFTWISVFSKGTCSECASRHGVTHKMYMWRKLDKGGFGGVPPVHFQCRCSLIPGRGLPVPKGLKITQMREMGIKSRVFRQVSEADYIKMKRSFIKCTDAAFGF